MKKFFLVFWVIAMAFLSCQSEPVEEITREAVIPLPEHLTHHVKAYLPTWKEWTADDIDGSQLSELILSFALVSFEEDPAGEYMWNGMKGNYTGEICDREISERQYLEIQKLRERYPELRITVALGGWGADGFSDAVLTEESRQIFTDSIVAYLLDKGFQGIDIDWEFPVSGGWGAIKGRPQDRSNFTSFIIMLREKLDLAGEQSDQYFELSVAANSGPAFYNEWVELDKIIPYVDYIHLMTYDNVGTWAGRAQPHSDPAHVEDTIVRFMQAGVPAEKLIFGAAFYGKWITHVDGLNGSFSENSTVTDISYNDIAANFLNKNGFVRHWDEFSGSHYLYNQESRELITYDDEQSISVKVFLAKKYEIAGAMFWEYTHDRSGTLVTALSQDFLK